MLSEVILKGTVFLVAAGAIGFFILFVIWLAKSVDEESLRSLLLAGLLFFTGLLAGLCVIMVVLALQSPGSPGQPPDSPQSGQPGRPQAAPDQSTQWTVPATR